MCRFESSDEYLRMMSTLDFGRIGTFEKQLDGFFEIGRSRLNRVTLAGHIKLRTEGDVARPLFFDNRHIASRSHDYPTHSLALPVKREFIIIVEFFGAA